MNMPWSLFLNCSDRYAPIQRLSTTKVVHNSASCKSVAVESGRLWQTRQRNMSYEHICKIGMSHTIPSHIIWYLDIFEGMDIQLPAIWHPRHRETVWQMGLSHSPSTLMVCLNGKAEVARIRCILHCWFRMNDMRSQECVWTARTSVSFWKYLHDAYWA